MVGLGPVLDLDHVECTRDCQTWPCRRLRNVAVDFHSFAGRRPSLGLGHVRVPGIRTCWVVDVQSVYSEWQL
jgi:hypothetical protein